MMNLYIIRHGQTVMNKSHALQGRSDFALNEDGIRQSEAAGKWFREQGIRFDYVFSSPLQRAVQTAKCVDPDAEIRTDERLLEMEYGPYEGMDLTKPAPEVLAFFMDFVNCPAPEGMEPLEQVVERLGEFLEEIRDLKGNVLISTHAIAMKGALEYLTPESRGSYWAENIANCEVYAAECGESGYSVPETVASFGDSQIR